MPNKLFSDAAQAKLGVIPISGISASFTPTANSGWITSSNTNYLTARAGSNLSLSTVDTAFLGRNFDGTTHKFYQAFLEFNVNLPSNAYITSVSLFIQYTSPTSDGFAIEASIYDYGTLQASDFVPGDSLLPGTKLGQTYMLQNSGFLGDLTRNITFDDIDTFRRTISSSGIYRILLSTTPMKSTTNPTFGLSENTRLSISSATLTFKYAVVPVALSQAYWGIKSSIARNFSPNINTLAVQVTSNTSWATVAEATPGAPGTTFQTSGVPNFRLEYLRTTDSKTGTVFYANNVQLFEFDTSTISANTNIIDVNFNLSWASSSSSFGLSEVILELYAFDFGTSVTDVDYRTRTWLQSATLLCSLSTSGLSGAGLKKFINNGYNLKNSINKGGMTRFVLTTSFHRTNISDINDFSHATTFNRTSTTLEVIV